MYAIAFDLKIDDLKKTYGDPYNGAYDEIKRELGKLGFEWMQGSLYMSRAVDNTLVAVFAAIERLKEIDWFVASVRDIRAFKVEDWSDFTPAVKKMAK
ncbi:MAG: virulence protein [Defluviitaleaceae bacterium]|nr:virulence protein [Defluviitaleaceae bacterium]